MPYDLRGDVMIRAVIAVCAGAAAGWLARSELAARAAARQAREARACPSRSPRAELGENDAWLLDALTGVREQLRPGERIVCLTVQAEWTDGTAVLISQDWDGPPVVRQLQIPVTGIGDAGLVHGWLMVPADVPDTPEGVVR